MRLAAVFAFTLAACQEPSPPPALPASAEDKSATGGGATPQPSAPETPISRDGWSKLVERLADLDGGARAGQVKAILEARMRERKLEDQKVEGGMVTLQTQLLRTCKIDEARGLFAAFQASEAESLAKDRDVLVNVLETAGPDGRAKIWQAGDVDQVLTRSREVMIARAQSSLPLWLATAETEEARLDAQRLVLTLNLESDAAAIRSRTDLAQLSNEIVAADPQQPTLSSMVMVGLDRLDARLLQEQTARFEALVGACPKIAAQQWMFLVAGGAATSYIGLLGGTNGMGDPADRRVTTTNALSSGMMMGMGQQGGQSGQLGGQSGQLGGQSGQPGGQSGQLGGQSGQPGGMSPGGANMSGQTPGGSPGAIGTGFPGVQAGGPGAASSTLPSTGGAAGPPAGGNANPR